MGRSIFCLHKLIVNWPHNLQKIEFKKILMSCNFIFHNVWRYLNCLKKIWLKRNTFTEELKLTPSFFFLSYRSGLYIWIASDFASLLIGSRVKQRFLWYEYCWDICFSKLLKDRGRLCDPDHDVQTWKRWKSDSLILDYLFLSYKREKRFLAINSQPHCGDVGGHYRKNVANVTAILNFVIWSA